MAGKNYGSKSYGKDSNKESLDKLREQLKAKTPEKIYLFQGDEPFLLDYYVGELKKLILNGDNESLNLSIFENSTNVDDIIDACDTYPVFGERKLVIVKNSGLFYGKSKKSANTSNDDDESVDDETKSEKGAPLRNKSQEIGRASCRERV